MTQFRQRYGILGLVLILHLAIFLGLYRLIIFPAPPPKDETDAEFQAVKIALPPAAPAPPTGGAGGSSFQVALPALPTPPAVITTPTFSATFNVAKVALPGHTPGAEKATPAGSGTGTGTGHNTGAGNSDSGVFTSDPNVFAAALGQTSIIVGAAPRLKTLGIHAKEINGIRNDLSLSKIHWIGWLEHHTQWFSHNQGDLTFRDDPSMSEAFENFFPPDGYIRGIGIEPDTVNCFVLMNNFRVECKYPSQFISKIQKLRSTHTRLCIIAFDNRPYQSLVNYVKESGGVILYPGGIPGGIVAQQLSESLPK